MGSKATRGRIALPPVVGYHAGSVSKLILAVFVAICAFALYFYAHHNWHPLPAGTTIDRIVVENQRENYRSFVTASTSRVTESR